MDLVKSITELISKTPFTREHVVTTGQQAFVLNHPSLEFVVKVSNDARGQLVLEDAYGFCSHKLGGLVAPYMMLPYCQFTLEGGSGLSTNVIVQQRATAYDAEYVTLSADRMIERALETIHLDRAILSRGVCISDTYHHNLGVLDNQVVVLDVGSAMKRPPEQNEKSRVTNEYGLRLNANEAYFLERGFCLHNRAFEVSLDDETGAVRRAFEEEIGVPMVNGYTMNLTADDIVAHMDFAYSLMMAMFTGHPLEGQIKAHCANGGDRLPLLVGLANNYSKFAAEMLNGISRRKYTDEFIETGHAEFKQFYADDEGTPVVFLEALAEPRI